MKTQERSCEGKFKLTRDEARQVVREMRARNARANTDKHHVNAYACRFCRGWHVGHTSPPKYSHYKRVKHFFYRESEDME